MNAVLDGAYLGAAYADRLGQVKLGSASISFKNADALDLPTLQELAGHADRLSPPDRGLRT